MRYGEEVPFPRGRVLGSHLLRKKINILLAMTGFGEVLAVVFVRALPSHCNASNLVPGILKRDKMWGDNLH